MKRFADMLALAGGDVGAIRLEGVDLRSPVPFESVRCIAVHANSCGIGGLERVVLEQCRLFRRMGIEVHLVLNVAPDAASNFIPEDVAVHVLPPPSGNIVEYLRKRADAVVGIVSDAGAQLYLDSAYQNIFMRASPETWDWLALKMTLGTPVLLHWHSVFARFLRMPGGERFASSLRALSRLCDGVIALSHVDEAFFSALGFRSWFIPNPVDDKLVSASECRRRAEGRVVLWCGRIAEVKRPLEALSVFRAAHEMEGGMRLLMVGGGDVALVGKMKEFISANGLEASVVMPGECADVYPFYGKSDVLLSTSDCEGYPMSFVEATAFGLPIVSVGKGYVELLRHNDGAVVVGRDDVAAAARALVELTAPGQRRANAARGVADTWARIAGFDLAEAYARVFSDVGGGRSKGTDDSDFSLAAREVVDGFLAGIAERGKCVSAGLDEAGLGKWLPLIRRAESFLAMLSVGKSAKRHRMRSKACGRLLRFLRGDMSEITRGG